LSGSTRSAAGQTARRPFEVPWHADGRARPFITHGLADSYRVELVRAAEVRGAAMTLETAADFAKSPQLVVLDQTTKDEFVPMNQKTRLESTLSKVSGPDRLFPSAGASAQLRGYADLALRSL
jgi:hypothetical protein